MYYSVSGAMNVKCLILYYGGENFRIVLYYQNWYKISKRRFKKIE